MKNRLAELPAVILAVGQGYRLQSEEHIVLKPLMALLGLTLLERSLLTCRQAGIREFIVVVGYGKDELLHHLEEVQKNRGLSIRMVENPDWEAGNGTSVSACSQHLTGLFSPVDV